MKDCTTVPSDAYPATTQGLRFAAWKELAKAGLDPKVETGSPRIWRIDGDLNGRRVCGTAAVRTSKDRWFGLTPMATGWKPLDRVDYVVVSAFSKRYVEATATIYIFDAADVRARFDEAYRVRKEAGHEVDGGQPFWVSLDPDAASSVAAVGGGIANERPNAMVASVDLEPAAMNETTRAQPQEETSAPEGNGAESTLSSYGMERVARFWLNENTLCIETDRPDIAALEKTVYAFVIDDQIVRIGSSKNPLSGRLQDSERDVSRGMRGDPQSPCPPAEAEKWRERLNRGQTGTVYARHGTLVETPVGSFPAYLDEESVLLGRHRPPLNRSLHR
jgi:hypothetical protein